MGIQKRFDPTFRAEEFALRRETLGLSQSDLAELIGTSQAAVSMWEKGARTPNDPAQVWGVIEALEAVLIDLVDRYYEAGEEGINLADMLVIPNRAAYERALPGMALDVPWAVHRRAVGIAHAQLRVDGYEVALFE